METGWLPARQSPTGCRSRPRLFRRLLRVQYSDAPVDIFYRETPHPEFGNKYFGIAVNYDDGSYSIFNADQIEDFVFGMVEDDNGDFQYSQYHHDYKSFNNGNMIDGGRSYTRYSGKVYYYAIKDGKMIKDVS